MSMHLHCLPALADNYIWCLTQENRALVVDPGDASVVEHWLQEQHLGLAAILVTHHHPDHTAGIAALRAKHPVPVFGPDEDIAGVDHLLQGGESLPLPLPLPPFGEAEIIAVPGHTRAHIAYFFREPELLFCGDTLFSAGCGRLFEGTAEQLYRSIGRLASLPDGTRLCCTHEYTLANLRFAAAVEPHNPAVHARDQEVRDLRRRHLPSLPALLGREKQYNPFLRSEVPVVVESASRAAGHRLSPGLETFAALRGWKDHF